MPWCDPCGRYYSPNTLHPDGTCPENHPVEVPKKSQKVPWHFWLLIIGVTLYLGWRLVQGVEWIITR